MSLQPRAFRLVHLTPDHPGFRDPVYRARRDAIAQLALDHTSGEAAPRVAYTEDEEWVWSEVWERLGPLQGRFACRTIVRLQKTLGLARRPIPQLEDLNVVLERATGFRMEPVAGLVDARDFFRRLADGVFLSTQYIRHGSRPEYTPEPDLIHELVGHAASLTDPAIAAVNRMLGCAAEGASANELRRLERIYWYALEFGLVAERGRPKALGAGLLSSCGELARFEECAVLDDWDPELVAETPYDPTRYQDRLFVAPSLAALAESIERWIARRRLGQRTTSPAPSLRPRSSRSARG